MRTMTRRGGTVRRAAYAMISVAVAAGLPTAAGQASDGDPDPSVVRTDQGAVRGELTPTARIFHGLPYASPTIEWRGVRDATQPSCTPACRRLTVTTPRGVSVGAGLPVHVHLGPTTASAAPDAVTVAVTDEGLAGQQAALRWVQRNAVPFGGDPEAVTLLGPRERLCAHRTHPGSAYLYATTTPARPCPAR
ncbi:MULTISPECIES: carboxylesterase family protein [unclassified Streptomyces]|uniref:carboxylesterase family protein n=1 Tax=unclassified Streptomyces TaxID=2593676 RepID=UPI0022B6CE69|nr:MULTISPECIES: carboxylesterase family protein [unclassified Streptomyces]MCZ7417425.1 carboxylesterase family protein [Streptomyces sp. WMMC897]MCZ7432747.1 carboxylesterase family protein [Streptomyces sp. WMMC1477]